MRTFERAELFIVDDRPCIPSIERPRSIMYAKECDTEEQDDEMISTISVQPHALASVIGAFADDPLWDEFLEEMAKARQKQNQTYAEAE